MIFTECPYCDNNVTVGYECGMPMGFLPLRCSECSEVMWIELTSMGGKTRTHDCCKDEIMREGDEEAVEAGAKNASLSSD